MSNLSAFLIAQFIAFTAIGVLYFLIRKWPKFHLTFIGKVLKIFYGFILILTVLLSLFFATLLFNDYWKNDRARIVTELQDVNLGWSKDELLFRKGEPLHQSNLSADREELIYGGMQVILENDKVIRLLYICNLEGNSDWRVTVGGISCDDSVDRLLDVYGEPELLSVSKDKLERLYNYPSYNLSFGLSKSKIETLIVYAPVSYPKGLEFFEPEIEEPLDFSSQGGAAEDGPWVDYSKQEVMQPKKTYSLDEVIGSTPTEELVEDHCAPDISRAERLKRLGLRGELRQTGDNSYRAGQYGVSFYLNDLLTCY